jgi:hypothetical protein
MVVSWFTVARRVVGVVSPLTGLGNYAVDTHSYTVGYDLTPLTGLGSETTWKSLAPS